MDGEIVVPDADGSVLQNELKGQIEEHRARPDRSALSERPRYPEATVAAIEKVAKHSALCASGNLHGLHVRRPREDD